MNEVNTILNTTNLSALESIFEASLVVQLTLLILIGLSVFVWGIAITKFQFFNKVNKANEVFLHRFQKTTSLDSLYEDLKQYEDSSVARVFKDAYEEMRRIAESPLLKQSENTDTSPLLSGLDNLERSLHRAIENEIATMESYLNVLATTGSTGPFIGLFGTVWGIMNSFHKIGQTGVATLAVVAPGISEALIATAIGLAAAIPAVVLYNQFIGKIKKQENILNNFASDYLNVVKRNFFSVKG